MGSTPFSPGGTVVCFCLQTLKDEVNLNNLEAKPLGQKETGQRFCTAQVADMVAAAGWRRTRQTTCNIQPSSFPCQGMGKTDLRGGRARQALLCGLQF